MVKSPNWHKSLSKTCDNPFAEQGFLVSALAWKRIAKKKTTAKEFAYLFGLSDQKHSRQFLYSTYSWPGQSSAQRQLDMSTVTAIVHEARVIIESLLVHCIYGVSYQSQ